MIVHVVYEIQYADGETGADDNVYFYGAYDNKRVAMKKARDLINNAKENGLHIDDYIKEQKNPLKENNCVDFYHDDECQDYKVISIGIEETKLIV